MNNHSDKSSQQKAAKVAGIMFLFSLIVPSVNWALILSKLVVADNINATANNIMTNELQFRIGISIELIMSVGLIVLGLALFIILKPVNRNLAILALLLKLVEASLAAAIVLASFIALQAAKGDISIALFTAEQMQVPVGLLLNVHTALFSFPMFFLGLDMMLFSYLFLQSKYIPKSLAGFGIFSFALIFTHSLMFIVAPDYATMPINQLIFWSPSALFEIMMGFWLLSKGLKIEYQS